MDGDLFLACLATTDTIAAALHTRAIHRDRRDQRKEKP